MGRCLPTRDGEGGVLYATAGKTTRFHYNGREPSGEVRSPVAGLSSGNERNWRELCGKVSTVKKREKEKERKGRKVERPSNYAVPRLPFTDACRREL